MRDDGGNNNKDTQTILTSPLDVIYEVASPAAAVPSALAVADLLLNHQGR